MTMPTCLARADGRHLAMRVLPGRPPTMVFLPGFASDMTGTKAEYLAAWCAARGQGFVRFDYSGHGASEGAFTDGTIGGWRDDALAVIDQATTGRLLLVGSSMGGWIALLVALARPERVAGFVGLAPAPDFSDALMWGAMAPRERETLLREGVLSVPSDYGPPLLITRRLIEEARDHFVLNAPIPLNVPVRLIHGQLDDDVPWERSLTLAEKITGGDVQVTFIKDAGHRLSRPGDLAVIDQVLEGLLGGKDGP